MSKIVVMDSGFGGLTVLNELKKAMPDEEYIYYGDSANAPYGEKTHEQLEALTKHICGELSSSYDVKCFVVACNTSSSEVWNELTKAYASYDFIGIEPALKWAVDENPGKRILVLATTATTKGKRLKARYAELKDKAEISLLAAPGIVPFVEGNDKDETAFEAYLRELLKDYIGNVDCVVLGCTHFPFVKNRLEAVLGDKVRFYDAALSVAEELIGIEERNKHDKGMPDISGDIEGHKVPLFIHTESREITPDAEQRDAAKPDILRSALVSDGIIFLNSDPGKIETEAKLLKQYSEMK